MTAADLARIYGVHIRTIRRWATQDRWRHHGRPYRYNLTDADRTYRKHHPSAVDQLRRKLNVANHA